MCNVNMNRSVNNDNLVIAKLSNLTTDLRCETEYKWGWGWSEFQVMACVWRVWIDFFRLSSSPIFTFTIWLCTAFTSFFIRPTFSCVHSLYRYKQRVRDTSDDFLKSEKMESKMRTTSDVKWRCTNRYFVDAHHNWVDNSSLEFIRSTKEN